MATTTVYGKTHPIPARFDGIVDFAVDIPAGDRPIRILQLTDMQIIDASQQRTPDRLNEREIRYWQPRYMHDQCLQSIRILAEDTEPDLIFITGDVVYGEFDDAGSTLDIFCDFMDSLRIPWAPVYGNHDNESARGVDWQNRRLETARHCLFKTGRVTGNGNYSVLILSDGQPVRVLYMLDSGGCGGARDASARRGAGLAPDQLALVSDTARALKAACDGLPIPGFLCYHIPSSDFPAAAEAAGYEPCERYTIGETFPAHEGDLGSRRGERHSCFTAPQGFREILHDASVDGVFVGHNHAINTSVFHDGIRWTYGLKTGQYDYFSYGHTGGTLVTLTLQGDGFRIHHVRSKNLPAIAPNPERY